MRFSAAKARLLRLLAVVATTAALGVAPLEDALRRDGPAPSGPLASTPADPSGPGVPDRGTQEEEPLSDPIDDELPESIELAGLSALPRRHSAESPAEPGHPPLGMVPPPDVRPWKRPVAPVAIGRTPLCTRLCRLTC